jgi:lysophospholipase L1-like esterase
MRRVPVPARSRRHVRVVVVFTAVLALAGCGAAVDSDAGSSASPRTAGSATPSPSGSPSADELAAGGRYLALGDSLAAGYQPGGTELRDTAYPALAAARLGRDGARLEVRNLACTGETTVTLTKGGRCDYAAGSQLAQAETVLRDRDSDVTLVTIDIGGNDLLRCVRGASFNQSCVDAGLKAVSTTLPPVLRRLRAAAGPDVPVLVIGYYNPWLAASYLGFGQQQIAPAAKAFTDLDGIIEKAATGAGTTFVSLARPFALGDTTPSTFGGRKVPRNVAQVCALTYICTARDIHLTDEGAATVAREIAALATRAGVG